jgi:hypothetical protein
MSPSHHPSHSSSSSNSSKPHATPTRPTASALAPATSALSSAATLATLSCTAVVLSRETVSMERRKASEEVPRPWTWAIRHCLLHYHTPKKQLPPYFPRHARVKIGGELASISHKFGSGGEAQLTPPPCLGACPRLCSASAASFHDGAAQWLGSRCNSKSLEITQRPQQQKRPPRL